MAEIPTSFLSSEVSHLHTQCFSSLVSAHLKDWHTGPMLELQLKVNNCRVWLNILFMHGGGGGGISLILSAATLSGLHLWLNAAALTSLLVCQDFQEPAYQIQMDGGGWRTACTQHHARAQIQCTSCGGWVVKEIRNEINTPVFTLMWGLYIMVLQKVDSALHSIVRAAK